MPQAVPPNTKTHEVVPEWNETTLAYFSQEMITQIVEFIARSVLGDTSDDGLLQTALLLDIIFQVEGWKPKQKPLPPNFMTIISDHLHSFGYFDEIIHEDYEEDD